jgi:hypothetical protein
VQPVGGDAGVHEIVRLEARDVQHFGCNLYSTIVITTTITIIIIISVYVNVDNVADQADRGTSASSPKNRQR